MVPRNSRPCGDLAYGQPARECQMEAKLLHYVGIAPFHQKPLLSCVQTGVAAAGKFRLGSRSTKAVQHTNASRSHPVQSVQVTVRDQRQKPAKRRQFQSVANGGGESYGKFGYSCLQCFHTMPTGQTERRLQRAMKPVFLRCHRNVMQTGQIGLRRFATPHDIPTEPRRAERRQIPFWRNVINRKPRV